MFLRKFILKNYSVVSNDMISTNGWFNARHITTVSDYPVSELSPSVIKEKLTKSTFPFVDGYTCFKLAECNFCTPLKKNSAGRSAELYINKQTGYYLCSLCKCVGTWEIFERLLGSAGKEPEKSSKDVALLRDGCASYYEKGQQSWKKVSEESVLVHELPDELYTKIFYDFGIMRCEKSISESLNLYASVDSRTLYLPICFNTQLVLGYITWNIEKGLSVTPRKNCAGVLLLAPKRKQLSAVVVSNLFDFFALASQNLPIHIICLPYGIANLPQISLPFLEAYEKLTLWFASVPGAWDASRNFAKKLNERRCSIVRNNEQFSSAADAVLNGLDVKKIITEAQPTWHQAVTTFSSLRADVLQELRSHDEVLGVRWRRYPSLNKTLRGFRRGELTVLTGPTGCGKTTFMSEYSLDLACQGVNTLWGSFEVRNVRLARTMLQQYVGRPLEKSLSDFDGWADDFERLPVYFLTFHGQQSIRTVMDAVQHAAYIHDIGHVIIDNVQFMIGMSEESTYLDRFHKQDLIIHSFRTFATRSNCHVTLVIHPRKERENEDLTSSSIFGGAKAAQEADNVLIIQDKRLTSVKGKKYLQVAKNRYTGDLGIMLLEFDKDSLSFGPKKKKVEDT